MVIFLKVYYPFEHGKLMMIFTNDIYLDHYFPNATYTIGGSTKTRNLMIL
jgi:hypothetical protein